MTAMRVTTMLPREDGANILREAIASVSNRAVLAGLALPTWDGSKAYCVQTVHRLYPYSVAVVNPKTAEVRLYVLDAGYTMYRDTHTRPMFSLERPTAVMENAVWNVLP